MGYNLGFGEFEVTEYPEERSARCSASIEGDLPEDAPYDSSGAGSRHNWTFPSYSAWANFTKRHGLHDVFYGNQYKVWMSGGEEFEALLRDHPGAAELTPEALARFEAALKAAPMSYEKAALQYEEWLKLPRDERHRLPDSEVMPMFDVLRLNWLVFWTRWCLENCKWPTFANG